MIGSHFGSALSMTAPEKPSKPCIAKTNNKPFDSLQKTVAS